MDQSKEHFVQQPGAHNLTNKASVQFQDNTRQENHQEKGLLIEENPENRFNHRSLSMLQDNQAQGSHHPISSS